jgi:alpha-D-xyloside xylohydrolase
MEVQAAQTNVSVQFYTPSIVRVTKCPEGKDCRQDKPVVIARPENVSLTRKGNTLSSSALTVKVDARTGSVEFLTAKGKRLLRESSCTF